MKTRSPAYGDAAIDAAGGIAGEAAGARALEMPDLAARAGVERVAFVGAGDVHDAIDDDRRHLKAAGVRQVEHPAGAELLDVLLRDLGEFGVAVAADIAVIGGPVDV